MLESCFSLTVARGSLLICLITCLTNLVQAPWELEWCVFSCPGCERYKFLVLLPEPQMLALVGDDSGSIKIVLANDCHYGGWNVNWFGSGM